MHAIFQYEFGPPDVLRYEERPDLQPGPDQVRIAVEACGVHLIDTSIRSGVDNGSLPSPDLPMIPGREVAGTVDRVGSGVPPTWLGRRVVAHLGAASGGYASQAVTDPERLHALPDNVTADVAVGAIGTGRTALGLLDQVKVGPKDIAVVTSAAGGLGVLLVQAVHRAGAEVIALAGGPEKVDIARAAGADLAVDYLPAGWDDTIRADAGPPTFVFDGVGGEVGRRLYPLLHPTGGTVVRYGWSSGEEAEIDDPSIRLVAPLGPQLTSRPGGMRSLESEALAAAADGTMVPLVGARFALADAAEAHRALVARRTHGKVVLVPVPGA